MTGPVTAPAVLETRDLSRTFGALAAVDEVSMTIAPGQVHAIIGPNGAGKTTLINLLSGELAPSGGRVLLDGGEITGLPAHRRARLGLGRTFQRTTIYPELTCLENVWLGARTRIGVGPRLFRSAVADRLVREAAAAALALVRLDGRAGDRASDLSHGEQRRVELAMVLAAAPRILLLDEPLAGMDRQESDRLAALIRGLTPDRTVVLIEHDMDAVFATADALTVMVAGKVLETGPPERIRASDAVQAAYLGVAEPGTPLPGAGR